MDARQNYDPSSVDSILGYASNLTGRTLSEVFPNHREVADSNNRGDLGLMVEKLYFGLAAGNKSDPDFAHAGLELKTSGLVAKGGDKWVMKERLVLTMIDFDSILDETWETSSLLRKCRMILLMLYFYEKEKSIFNRRFVMDPILLDLKSDVFDGIRDDWEAIRKKVLDGKAHELSEGDTFILGACRKGAGGPYERLRKQPNSIIPAKARAFSIKQGFLTHLINAHHLGELGTPSKYMVENLPKEAFSPFIGLTIDEISNFFNQQQIGKRSKVFNRKLAEEILLTGGVSKKDLETLGIEMKTMRLSRKGNPKEDMSFPRFSFTSIISEKWENSTLFEKLESKFLFVIFREDAQGVERLWKVAFWNMPFADRAEAQKVWEDTKNRLELHLDTFPTAKENPVAHVRPKARNAQDCELAPSGLLHVKRCFWLNRQYLKSVLTDPTFGSLD